MLILKNQEVILQMQTKLELALNNQVAIHESLLKMSSILEKLNRVPGPTKAKNKTEKIKAEIEETEMGRIRAILFKGGISFEYDQIMQMIAAAKERHLFGLNLLTIFFSQEELVSVSYEKDQKNPLDPIKLNLIEDLVFLVFPEDSEKRSETWASIMAKIKSKIRTVRRNLRVNKALLA